MKKRLFSILFILMLCMIQVTPAFAASDDAEQYERLQDLAGCLSENEASEILATLDEISERQECDVVIITVESLDGATAESCADDYFDYGGYGIGRNKDGVLLLVSTKDRKWHISTHGYGITAFTDAGIQYVGSQFKSDLSDKNYAEAFKTFAKESDDFLTQAKNGKPYDTSTLPREGLSVGWLIGAVVVGVFFGIMTVSFMKDKLASVRRQPAANSYVRKDSLNITDGSELFLYTTMTQTERPKESSDSGSSTHESSSGETHGGGGGDF